jgi:hypothetical protein
MGGIMYIAELPDGVQALIAKCAIKYLKEQGLSEDEISETIRNIMDERIENVLNEDGTFIR